MLSPAQLNRLHVVLVATRNPLNIGAAARAMSNFGFSHLRVVNPYEVAFREARSAVGSATLLKQAEEFKTVADAITDCSLVVGTTALRHRELRHPLRVLEQGATLIRRRLTSSRVALLFGSEKVGLSNRDLSHCHWLMRIPTRQEHGSMNLGQAVAVCLYELVRGERISERKEKEKPATAVDLERITVMLLDALRVSGFLKPGAPSEDKVRRLVRHLNLPADDAALWLGMLHQMLWKLRG